MAEVRYQYRGVGLLPPELAGWLDYYVRNRLPIAMEEWQAKVAAAKAAGKLSDETEKWIDFLSKVYDKYGTITSSDINVAGTSNQAGASVSREQTKANVEALGWRTKASIANMIERSKDRRQSRDVRNDLATSMLLTSNELAGIDDLTKNAKSIYDSSGGTEREKIRNAIKVASDAASATAAGLADKNSVHASAYLDRAAQSVLTALGVQGEARAEAAAAVNDFFYARNGMVHASGVDGKDTWANAMMADPEFGPIIMESFAKVGGAGATATEIPDMRRYEFAPVVKIEGDTVTPVEASPTEAAALVAGTSNQTDKSGESSGGAPSQVEVPPPAAGEPATPATSVDQSAARASTSTPPPPAGYQLSGGVIAPGGIRMLDAPNIAAAGTGVGAAGREQMMVGANYAIQKIEEADRARKAAIAAGATEVPPFRLAPEPGPNPRQAEFDKIKSRLDEMRKRDPDAYERFRHMAGEVKRSRTPDSAIRKDAQETALDKIVKDTESPDWSTGPMETLPSERAAEMGREASKDFAALVNAQRENGIYDTPEAKAQRDEFLRERATVLSGMSETQRKAFGGNFAVSEDTWNQVDSMVKESRVTAAKAKAAQPPGMFESPEDTANLDKALAKAAASGPTPNDVRARTRDVAEKVYEAAVADAADDGDYAGAFADAVKTATNGAVKDIDIPTFIKDFKDIWAADERPGPALARQQTAAKLQAAFGVVPELPVGTPKATPSMPGEVLREKPSDVPPPLPGQPPPLPATGWTVPAAIPVSNAAVGGVMNPGVGGFTAPPPTPMGAVTGMGAQVDTGGVPSLAFPETDEENEVYDYLTESWKDANPRGAGESDDAYHARAVGEATKLFQSYKAQEASP